MKVQFKHWSCEAIPGSYGNGNKAIELIDPEDGERVAVATVNLIDEKIDDDEVFIKGYAENLGMAAALVSAGIIYPTPIQKVETDFVTILSYKLSTKALKEIFK